MPNWCWNNLIISPSDSDESGEGMKRLRAKLLFMVEDMTANPKVWGGSYDYLVGREDDWDEVEGWYEHNKRVYGSKWQKSAEDFIEAVEDDGESITMGFQSAWSPVVGFTQLLSSQYRLHIEHTYDETGDWYAGKLVVDSGEILEEFCLDYYAGTYKIDTDLFWHELENNMEDWFDDMDEAKESYNRTLIQLDFLDTDELKKFNTLYKDGLAFAKKREKMEKKAGLENWKQYMVNGQKLKYVGWINAYKFYDENNQHIEFENLPKGIIPVETEEVTN
jgi:hypothetical protein